jgi:hypothetical protein
MRCCAYIIAAALLSALPCQAGEKPGPKVFVAVFDFTTKGEQAGNATTLKGRPYGVQLADSVRLKLRKQGKQWDVLDRLSTADASGPVAAETDPAVVRKLLGETLACDVGLFGTVQNLDGDVRADIICIDLREGSETPMWRKVFSDDTERSRAVIATGIVEAVTGQAAWKPPEYGDEPEPTRKDLGEPLNVNGTFDAGRKGWDAPDNLSTFIVDGPEGRGKVLRVRTDLQREPWLAYRKALRTGQADPTNPPNVARDTGYGSVAGLEGVHYRSDWISAEPGRRYWLLADCCPSTAKSNPESMFFPKVFVKGFKRTPHALDGLPESSLAELNLTPQAFAALPPDRRKELIAADAEKHPMRYVRECYRWYLACRVTHGEWEHFAAPFPPRGGLPEDVEFLQIQIYSYWPPGEYLWDNVLLFRDPARNAPLLEAPARTPNAGRTSDTIDPPTKQ